MEFDPLDSEITIELCKTIINWNRNTTNEIFLPFFPIIIQRVNAAILI